MAFSPQIVTQITWQESDDTNPTVAGILSGDVNLRRTLLSGSGTDSGNIGYSVSGSLGSGASVSYNLLSITRAFFNGSQTSSITNVKALEVINLGSGTADVLLVGSGSQPFTPWAYASGTSVVERIEPGSSWVKNSLRFGWTPTSNNRNINIKNLSTSGVPYYFAVVGCSG